MSSARTGASKASKKYTTAAKAANEFMIQQRAYKLSLANLLEKLNKKVEARKLAQEHAK